jgi:uncharacterized protein (UPF0248 family)
LTAMDGGNSDIAGAIYLSSIRSFQSMMLKSQGTYIPAPNWFIPIAC